MYQKLLFAFTSLTIAASISAFACDSGENNNSNNIDPSAQYEVQPDPAQYYVPTKTKDGRVICVPAGTDTQSHEEQVQILGYLRPGTVLPTPSKPYSYEAVHKKELEQKLKRHKTVVKQAKAKKTEDAYQSAPKVEKPQQNESMAVPSTTHIEPQATITNPSVVHAPMHNTQSQPNTHVVTPTMVPSTTPSVPTSAAPKMELPKNDVPVAKPVDIKPTDSTLPAVPAVPQIPSSTAPSSSTDSQPVSQLENAVATDASDNAPIMGRITTLEYAENELDVSQNNQVILKQIADEIKRDPTKAIKIQSYAAAGNPSEARRNSFQRAIKVRKYLLDQEVNASKISVNAVDDPANKLNRIEIAFEQVKA